MKKYTILGAIVITFMTGNATDFSPAVKLNLPTAGAHPILSPDASKMLYTTDNHCGLSMVDLNTMHTTVIDESMAAGNNPAFSPDANSIVYRTASTNDGLLVHDIRVYDLNEGKSKVKAQYSRSTAEPIEYTGSTNYAIDRYHDILVCHDGVSKKISPLPDAHSYLWASLSPDGKHLLFTEPFKGVYVANADGSNPVLLAPKGDHASWVNDNTIVYVLSHDDGYIILDSSLMTINIDGTEARQLTPNDMIVGEASAANNHIVFSTISGDLYLINAK